MKKAILLGFAFAAAVAADAEPFVLEGTNNVNGTGFSTVAAAAGAQTILTVPYQACATDGGTIPLAALVSTNGLPNATSENDAERAARLYVLPAGSGSVSYQRYYNNSVSGWTKYGDTTQEAADLALSAGDGLWLALPAGAAASVFLKGDLVTNQCTTVSHGYNLLGAASAEAYNLGQLAFSTPHAGSRGTNADKILVLDPTTAAYTVYYFLNTDNKWHKDFNAPTELADIPVPAGQGFWYYRQDAGDLTVTKAK